MIYENEKRVAFGVASFAEAWIEIVYDKSRCTVRGVASFAEAWIEMSLSYIRALTALSRLLRGGVD